MIDATQLWCPQSGGQRGEDNTTHHLVPPGMRCRYCRVPQREIVKWEERRLELVNQYAPFHDRGWLESLDALTLHCLAWSGDLDRPTLFK